MWKLGIQGLQLPTQPLSLSFPDATPGALVDLSSDGVQWNRKFRGEMSKTDREVNPLPRIDQFGWQLWDDV